MYSAIVCRLTNVRPHPNADRLALATVKGYQIVIGKDDRYQEGALGCFFPCDGQLSYEFCLQNDLCPRLNEKGERVGGGFIDPKHRRVRSQRFRGEKSEGFWVPLTYFEYLGTGAFGMSQALPIELEKEGFEFTELQGHPVCNKYVTKATLEFIARKKKKGARRETVMFKAHIETEQLRKHAQEIRPGALIILTEKLHGTSQRYGHVLHEAPLPWWKEKVNAWAGREIFKPRSSWTHVLGTRNVILGEESEAEPFRSEVVARVRGQLHKGETLYFEVVGWMNETTPIMIPQPTSKTQDKEVQRRYGGLMTYSYGQAPGTCELYVYRITQTNEDGYAVELPWCTVKERSKELGVKTVPELMRFVVDEEETGPDQPGESTRTQLAPMGYPGSLLSQVEALLDGPSKLDPSHIREGVCVRVEQGKEILVLKDKSFLFGVLEGYAKEDEALVDIEEAA